MISAISSLSFKANPPEVRSAISYLHRQPDLWEGKYKDSANCIEELNLRGLVDDFALKVWENLPDKENDGNPASMADRLCKEGNPPLLTRQGLASLGFKVEPFNLEKPIDAPSNLKISLPEKGS